MPLKEIGVRDLPFVESVFALCELGSGRPLQGDGAVDGAGTAVSTVAGLLAVAANVALGGWGGHRRRVCGDGALGFDGGRVCVHLGCCLIGRW